MDKTILDRLDQVRKKIDDEFSQHPEETFTKVQLYSELELLRMDFLELPQVEEFMSRYNHTTDESEKAKIVSSNTDYAKYMNVLGEFNEYRLKLKAKRGMKLSPFESYWNLFLATLYIFVITPVMCLFSILTIFNPILRLLNVNRIYWPIQMIHKIFVRGLFSWIGLNVHWAGLDNLELDEASVYMFSHGSNLDPMTISSGPLAYTFISKRLVFYVPIIGWFMWLWGHIPIDRENRDKAIQSVNTAKSVIVEKDRHLAVSPEGTRTSTGRLLDFKKGPFHISKAVGRKIKLLHVTGAWELWPPTQWFTNSGDIYVRVLPSLDVTEQDDYNSLASKTRRAYLRASAEPFPSGIPRYSNRFFDFCIIPAIYALTYLAYKAVVTYIL